VKHYAPPHRQWYARPFIGILAHPAPGRRTG